MKRKNIVDLIGNILVGIAAPYLFLLSDDPFNDLFGAENIKNEQYDKEK